MKEVELIQQTINKIPRGRPFAAKSISRELSYANVRQVLSRLVHAGELTRAMRGIYVRPKEVPYLGKVLPGSEEIVKMISKQTGETIAVHGAEAARILQLSSQVPMQSIFYTTGNSRHINMGKMKIIMKHISPRKLVNPGSITCLVISALWYLGKNQVNSEVIKKIKNQLKPEQFSGLLNHTTQMPTWMSGAISQYQRENTNV